MCQILAVPASCSLVPVNKSVWSSILRGEIHHSKVHQGPKTAPRHLASDLTPLWGMVSFGPMVSLAASVVAPALAPKTGTGVGFRPVGLLTRHLSHVSSQGPGNGRGGVGAFSNQQICLSLTPSRQTCPAYHRDYGFCSGHHGAPDRLFWATRERCDRRAF